MKIYYNSATEAAPVVVDGDPPTDQSATVAALQAQLAAAQSLVTALQAKIAAAQAALA
jgi:multidrug resistance efflux pump